MATVEHSRRIGVQALQTCDAVTTETIPKRRTRIILVDDNTVFRQSLALVIDGQLDLMVCGEAGSGEDALKILGQANPDVAVVDVSLPAMNGIELTETIKRLYPQVAVIVLTMHDATIYASKASEAGAAMYLQKQTGMKPLLESIRQVF
ncbi:MAG TPA: response regulator transcription factor [Terriglobales bacterium]